MSMRRLGTLCALLAASAALAVPAAAVESAAPQSVSITACKGKIDKPGNYKCVGPFSLGIPSKIPVVYFYVATRGNWPRGGTFSVDILDASKQPLINPASVKLPQAYPTGFVWFFWLNGPFPKQTIYLQPKLNGKAVGSPLLFRFV